MFENQLNKPFNTLNTYLIDYVVNLFDLHTIEYLFKDMFRFYCKLSNIYDSQSYTDSYIDNCRVRNHIGIYCNRDIFYEIKNHHFTK
jgi:hypothetical protein